MVQFGVRARDLAQTSGTLAITVEGLDRANSEQRRETTAAQTTYA